MNMQQILNDPELSKELDKAYALAAPYREKVQYKLHLLQSAIFFDSLVYNASGTLLICAFWESTYIHPMLKV